MATITQRIAGTYDLPLFRRVAGSYVLPVVRRVAGSFLAPGILRRVAGTFDLPGKVFCRVAGSYALPTIVFRRVAGSYALLDYTPVSRRVAGRYALPSLTPSVAATTWSWSLGDDYDLDGLTLTGDRDSFAWTVELTLADEATYLACAPGQRLLITLAGQAMALILESRTREVGCGTVSYTATGRTLSCLLDTPYSDTVTRTWARTTARAAAEALCAAVELDLSWEVCDWTIPTGRLTASAETPISILSRLAAACGAVVQPTLVGGVRVIYRYPVGVNELADVTPAVSLDFDRTVETLSEEFQGQPGYDAVTVVDDRAETAAYLSVTTDDSRNAGRTTFPPGEACYIRVYHETDYTVAVTSGTAERVAQDETESLSATVTFDGTDTADLEAFVASVDDVIWYGTDGGEAVPNGGASIILAGGAVFGVALITYTTRYDVWRYTPAALGDTFAAAIRVEAEDIVSDDTDIGGLRLTVSRGDGLVPAPDELSAALACSPAPATQAGRNYLDEYGQSSLSVDVKSWPEGNETWALPGDVVEVADTDRGEIWRGTATAVSLELTVDDTGARLLTETTTVERPMP